MSELASFSESLAGKARFSASSFCALTERRMRPTEIKWTPSGHNCNNLFVRFKRWLDNVLGFYQPHVLKHCIHMSSVLIEVRQQYSKEQECAIMEAVHSALREAFKILPGDRNVRLVVHEPHRFECPPSRTNPELYTHISSMPSQVDLLTPKGSCT